MEKTLMNLFDQLSIEQTEKLIVGCTGKKLPRRSQSRIKKSVYAKVGIRDRTKIPMFGKLLVCAAISLFIFTSLSLIGLDKVSAAFRSMFTFLPGVGITETNETPLYVADRIVGQTRSGDAVAILSAAGYVEDHMVITIEVFEKELTFDDFRMYIDGVPADYQRYQAPHYLVTAFAPEIPEAAIQLQFSYKTAPLSPASVVEIEITGFSERLSFRLYPCTDYEDILEIGPTAQTNDISITVTAERFEDWAFIWCYPYVFADSFTDEIIGYGSPQNLAWKIGAYIETQSGTYPGAWRYLTSVKGRLVFPLSEKESSAILHIPYLAMRREEEVWDWTFTLPTNYTTMNTALSLENSLGRIHITEMERKPNDQYSDIVVMKVKTEAFDDNKVLSSFFVSFDDESMQCTQKSNIDTGCIEYMEITAGKDDSEITLHISSLYYYLLGEYEIPVEIP